MCATKLCALGRTGSGRCSRPTSNVSGSAGCGVLPNGVGNVYEVFAKINGKTHYLWRAVDHEGEILESYVTKKRGKSAALRFFKKALKPRGSPVEIVTDGPKSYPAALRELGIEERREMRRWFNNRAENLHLLLRR